MAPIQKKQEKVAKSTAKDFVFQSPSGRLMEALTKVGGKFEGGDAYEWVFQEAMMRNKFVSENCQDIVFLPREDNPDGSRKIPEEVADPELPDHAVFVTHEVNVFMDNKNLEIEQMRAGLDVYYPSTANGGPDSDQRINRKIAIHDREVQHSSIVQEFRLKREDSYVHRVDSVARERESCSIRRDLLPRNASRLCSVRAHSSLFMLKLRRRSGRLPGRNLRTILFPNKVPGRPERQWRMD